MSEGDQGGDSPCWAHEFEEELFGDGSDDASDDESDGDTEVTP